ncbi:Protein cms1 [Stygiomarasmius scandens]|uniref:Protein cms1 n=1 Tax=Marasmiellus scandens TaxID=2682957 RepID=A0ABR1JTP3_9AGAR
MGGDDLDDFVLDGYVSASGDEIEDDVDGSQVDDAVSGPSTQSTTEDQRTEEKKRKRKAKLKERKAKRRKLIESTESENTKSITESSPHELGDYLASLQAKTFKELSPLELEDMRIPETSIADTTAWTHPRTLDNLTEFIIKVVPNLHTRLSQKSKKAGSPTLLFVTGAALRVADVTRILKDKKLRGDKGGEVAKLFAKHFKLSEHVSYLKRTKVGAAVGTPGRIGKLLCETDALTISALSHIILDTTYRDAKQRNLLDIPETRDEVFKSVLGAPGVLQAIKAGKIQVVLY